jgi:subtilisin family serine protease
MKNFSRILPLFLVFLCFSAAGYAFTPGKYVFMDDQKVIAPRTDYSVVLITFEENLDEKGLQEFETSFPALQLARHQSYPWRNTRLYSLPPAYYGSEDAAEAYLSGIRAHTSVLAAYPAFIRNGETAYLDHLFLLNIRHASITDGTLDRLLKPFHAAVVEELDMKRSVTLAVHVPAEVNIFEVCMELAKSDAVDFAQPNFHLQGRADIIPNDPLFSTQWFLNQASDADIDAPEAWDITTGSSSIAVAVIDGHGFDLAHAEMVGKYLSPYNAVDDNNNPSAIEDEENHGTPCAGLIGALTNNALGVAGVGYNTKVVPIKMGFGFGSGGTFQTTELIMVRSCEHVMTAPYDIVAVSNSYTMGSWANIAAIRTAFANMRTDSRDGLGCVVLASTGNDNAISDEGYPCWFAHVVGVGSTDRYDDRSSFSNYGDSTDIAAPGSDTWTIDRTGLPGYTSNDYNEFNGTSASCPIAAGVVGLIASTNPNYTWKQLRTKLYSSCEKVGGYSYTNNPQYPYGTWSLQLGYGRVNALNAVAGGSLLDPPTNLSASVNGNNVQLTWTAPGGGGGTEEELIYDNNVSTGSYKYPGYTMSTHMSPDGPCQVLTLKYYTTNEGSDNQFYAKVFNWAGSQPGTTVLHNSTETAANGAWVEVDVSGAGINVTGDFVVGFGSFTEQAYLGYDANLNNGRSWDFQESSQTWGSWNETYLIRAVVLYPGGKTAMLGGEIPATTAELANNTARAHGGMNQQGVQPLENQYHKLLGLLGYNVYRDGNKVNTSLVANTYYNDNALAAGTYEYTVTAVYDEGESDPAGPVEAIVSGTALDPPVNLQAWATGTTVNVTWTSPQAGTEEWLYYHDGTFESSFASTDGGAGIAQLFALPNYPVTLSEIRFFTSNYESWSQPMTVYVLDGSGSNILGGPYSTSGVNNNWVSINTNVTINQSSFMIATYNDDPGGPYVGVDDSFFDQSLYFGSHTGGFTELSQLGNYEYVGSHEAKVFYHSKYGKKVTAWLRPSAPPPGENIADRHPEKEALSAPYPDGTKALLGYNIFRDGTKLNSSTWTSTSYADQAVAPGTYDYSVSAVYDEGESAQAGPVEVTVSGVALEAPTNLNGIVSNDMVTLSWSGPGGGSQEELIYDNGETDDGYTYPGYTMATHMSPSGPCQVLEVYYLTSFDAGGGDFDARIFNWAGAQPGNTILYESSEMAEEGWTTLDIRTENVTVSGDFVVGFGSVNEKTFLAFDPDLDNGRSWDRDDASGSWSSWNEAYIIRALVEYADGKPEVVGNSKDFLGYNLYRDDVKINTSLITSHSTTDQVPTWGEYNYNVTAVYDEGESAYSNTFTMSYVFGIEELWSLDIRVFPNPASDRIFIQSGHPLQMLELFDSGGRSIRIIKTSMMDYTLDVNELRPGLYLLRLENEKGLGTARILVR